MDEDDIYDKFREYFDSQQCDKCHTCSWPEVRSGKCSTHKRPVCYFGTHCLYHIFPDCMLVMYHLNQIMIPPIQSTVGAFKKLHSKCVNKSQCCLRTHPVIFKKNKSGDKKLQFSF
jgi:hypothetical protein